MKHVEQSIENTFAKGASPCEPSHPQNSFVLRGDVCYSEGPNTLRTVPGGYVVCENGRCEGVYTTLPPRHAALPITDYGSALVLPGLCDLHTHAPQFSFRALGMDLELLEWLERHTFPEEAKYRDLTYAETAYGAFVDAMLKGPNTRMCVFATVHSDATLLLMDKLEESGLVSLVGKVNMDRNCPDSLREENAGASLQSTGQWLRACAGRYRNTRPILTPRFIPSCSDDLMEGLAEFQQAQGLPVQSHLSENPSEIEWVRKLCPTASGYADAYLRFGLLGGIAPTIMAHCVWPRPDEIALLARQGVYVAHCPQSNLNLSSGIAPVRKLLGAGVLVGLGSDVAGGCHASIFRAMSDAIQASKMYWRLVDSTCAPLSLAEAFYLGTLGGGGFFGKVGSFLPGYELDALVVDDAPLDAPFALNLEERLARTVYLAGDESIKAKYVRGLRLF